MAQNLEVRNVKSFFGKTFFVPAYQRGYRWREAQVEQLLCDIDEARKKSAETPYLLQPIVLKKCRSEGADERYEVIDGQQRLTTIWIILHYLRSHGFSWLEKYVVEYETETRKRGDDFLSRLGTDCAEPQTIDEECFKKNYEEVTSWFGAMNAQARATNSFVDPLSVFGAYLLEYVQVIWYEVEEEISDRASEEIFISLNRGRIPLVSSELVKTLILVKGSRAMNTARDDVERQTEIATEWDQMESALSDPEFWAFVGGNENDGGKPRMDHFLELLPRPDGELWESRRDGDDYEVFNRYEQLIRVQSEHCGDGKDISDYVLDTIWRGHILSCFQKLRDWSKDVRLFHKIGFLVAIAHGQPQGRIDLLTELLCHKGLKSELENLVNGKIRKEFEKLKPIDDLGYDSDSEMIYQILLLFNVVTCMEEANKANTWTSEWYSFARHAEEQWSIEHINPQSELLIADSADRLIWKKWLELQRPFLPLIANDPKGQGLAKETEEALGDIGHLDGVHFKALSERIVAAFKKDFDSEEENSIGNLALLSKKDNSSIGASIFLSKRHEIVRKVSEGGFVPMCTRRVFLKYYTTWRSGGSGEVKPEEFGLVFWTKADAKTYRDRIVKALEVYLPSCSVCS